MSTYEVKVSTDVDTSELDAAQKKLDNLVKNDKQIKVDFNIDGMNNLNKINGMFKNIEKNNKINVKADMDTSGIKKGLSDIERAKRSVSTLKIDADVSKANADFKKFESLTTSSVEKARKLLSDINKDINNVKLAPNDSIMEINFNKLTSDLEKYRNQIKVVQNEQKEFTKLLRSSEKAQHDLESYKVQSNIAKMKSELNSFSESYDIDKNKFENIESIIKEYSDTMDKLRRHYDNNDSFVLDTDELSADLNKANLAVERFENTMSELKHSVKGTLNSLESSILSNDIQKYMKENTRLTKEYEDALNDLSRRAASGENVRKQFASAKSEIALKGLNGKSFIDEIARGFKQIGQFATTYGVIQDVFMDGGRKMVSNVVTVNDAMTDLRMATSLSNDEAYKMMDTYYELGDKLKATGIDIAKSSTEWLKQGKAIQEASKLTEDSIVLSKIGDLSSEEATKTITAAMKSYNIAEDQVMGFVDQISAIDMASATDVGGLATAFNEVAANAKTAGVETQNLLSYAAVIGETTQEGMASVGTSLNAIFSRMGNIKLSRLKDYETGEDLSNVETVLRGVGISLRDTQDEFKDFDLVLSETAEGWKTFSGVQKRAVAQAFAGTHHMNEFMVLMEQWGNVEKYIDIANNASGESMEKYAAYQESISGKIEGFENKFQSLSTSLLSSDVFGFLVDSGTSFLGVLDGILNKFGSFSSLLGLFSGTVLSKKGLGNDNIVEFAPFYKVA
nr:MAG TPA: minor tail protein [Caudoviricetes sp.]